MRGGRFLALRAPIASLADRSSKLRDETVCRWDEIVLVAGGNTPDTKIVYGRPGQTTGTGHVGHHHQLYLSPRLPIEFA